MIDYKFLEKSLLIFVMNYFNQEKKSKRLSYCVFVNYHLIFNSML